MTQDELKEVLRLHKMWLSNPTEGKKANLRFAHLSNTDLSHTDLRYADLRYATMIGADLSGADMSNANMNCANLYGADLSDANLRYAGLRSAILSNADLRYAGMSYATMIGADLSGADMSEADLAGANLIDADLRGSNLRGAKCGFDAFFSSAKGAPIYQAVCGFGSRNATLTLLAQGKHTDWRWFTGCFEGSEVELRSAVVRKHGNSKAGKGYLLAINYLVAQAELNAKGNN